MAHFKRSDRPDRADRTDTPEWSYPVFPVIVSQWADWEKGIPPGREWKGRGAQNPRLLEAFGGVSRAFGRWQDSLAPKGPAAGESIHDDPEIRRLRGGR